MSLETESKAYWDPSDVEGKLKRVFDICDSCRCTRSRFWEGIRLREDGES